jgi:beta-aspartyl-peptidase (threonine type)
VEAAIKVLEDSPLFNAGHGAVLNREGFCELDAAIMDGATRRAGAVAAVRRIRNPIEAARLVMERTPHLLLAGEGADLFAEKAALGMAEPGYFITEPRRKQLEEILERERAKPRAELDDSPARTADRMGTVGAVAVDRSGNLAAGTSTGGLPAKMPGRVGDSPLIGAGTWADNATCAVSATGQGEVIIRAALAHDIASLMAYRNLSLREAASLVVNRRLVALGGEGGVIAVDPQGQLAMPFNSAGMYRAAVREGAKPHIAIYPETDPR